MKGDACPVAIHTHITQILPVPPPTPSKKKFFVRKHLGLLVTCYSTDLSSVNGVSTLAEDAIHGLCVRELHEAEPPRLPRVAIHDHLAVRHLAELAEVLPQFIICGLKIQSSHKDLHWIVSHGCWSVAGVSGLCTLHGSGCSNNILGDLLELAKIKRSHH